MGYQDSNRASIQLNLEIVPMVYDRKEVPGKHWEVKRKRAKQRAIM